jgi:hypothetical protein
MVALICGLPVSVIYSKRKPTKAKRSLKPFSFFFRLCTLYSLICFIASLLFGCKSTDDSEIAIQWRGKRAIGISIPNQFIESIPADSLEQLLVVRLSNQQTAIAGQYQRTNTAIIFEPLVPFTRGMHYVVWLRNSRLSDITVPTLTAADKPALLAIYPSDNSLPDNLLKIYLHFSRPMREGQSEKYVALVRNNTDTLSDVFLNLQPELWNADRTLLTLWLDPGRIKRDLQPNKRLGAPLQTGGHYQLVVDAAWPDEQGAQLGKITTKSFVSVQRDSLSPDPMRWSIVAPKAGSNEPLNVAFGESLDYSLLTETLHIVGENGKPVAGTWEIGKQEKQSQFKPSIPWQTGQYTLQIESRLEDLAGNNLNRPFDRDITKKGSRARTQPFAERLFQIH